MQISRLRHGPLAMLIAWVSLTACIDEPEIIPGAVGAVCESSGACESGACVEVWDGRRCEGPCDAEIPCPRGWRCSEGRCVPRYDDLCRVCDVDEDCPGADGGVTALCVPRPDEASGLAVSACLPGCTDRLDCPVGSDCQDVPERPGTRACVPTELSCPVCSSAAVVRRDTATCSRANALGTCLDAVRCDAPGAPVCGAREASSEVCNGVDDDCDGAMDGVDDGLELVSCELSTAICEGARKGPSLCVDGRWEACGAETYGGAWRAQEDGLACDTVDNDCDGSVDEGLSAQTPDGAALSVYGALCGTGVCAGGTVTCDVGTGGLACSTLHQAGPEICNGLDDDCDGVVDDIPADEVPLNTLQAGACAGSRRRCAPAPGGGASWVDDYSAIPSFSQPDLPDAGYFDGDCDGVDGDLESSILVDQDTSNSPSSCGTRETPCSSIAHGLEAARATGKTAILLRSGRYAGPVLLDGTVSVHGGYLEDWSRCRPFDADSTLIATDCASVITSAPLTDAGGAGPAPEVSVRVSGKGAAPVVLSSLVLTGFPATAVGASTIGLLATDADVRLEQVLIQRGRAAAGADGAAAPASARPAEPPRGNSGVGQTTAVASVCDETDPKVRGGAGGAAVASGCGAASAGGAGGRGGHSGETCTPPLCPSLCVVANGGTGAAGAGTGGGAGGAGGSSTTGARAGSDGAHGAHGQAGAGGRRSTGLVLAAGWPVGLPGGGGGVGTPGAGGAGGGGGGGYVNGVGIAATGYPGGGGGSGGAGGCAATAGGGGGLAGGGAYGVVALRSKLDAVGVRILGGAGGAGGRGAAGVTTPTAHRLLANCGDAARAQGGVAGGPQSSTSAGRGGAGGLGGVGGASGAGAGGAGGPIVGVLIAGGELVNRGISFENPGSGGAGGAPGQQAAMPCGLPSGGEGEPGEQGPVVDVWTCPAEGVCAPPGG